MAEQDPLVEIKRARAARPDLYPADFDAVVAMLEETRGEVERLRELLSRLEWADKDLTRPSFLGAPSCPACSERQHDGHKPGCWLAAELHPKG
jgi:hypothetical protein